MKVNVYKVTYFGRAPQRDGQPGTPGAVQSVIVGATSAETAVSAVHNSMDEMVEIEHVQNLFQDVNLVIDNDSLSAICGPFLAVQDAKLKQLEAELAKFQQPQVTQQEQSAATSSGKLATEKIQ